MLKATKICMYSLGLAGVLVFIISSCAKHEDIANPKTAPTTVTDKDGNVYHTVTIGSQVWMVENLRTTKYNDGTAIPLVTEQTVWNSLTTPGYCWYNNDAGTYKNAYGGLYNWYSVNTGKLAPTGWHVPTDAEWAILTAYLGGDTVAGGKMKSTGIIETGTGLWLSPNTSATNESGFTALPAGLRDSWGLFYGIDYYGGWWSSSERGTDDAVQRHLYNRYNTVFLGNNVKNNAFSVRCLRD